MPRMYKADAHLLSECIRTMVDVQERLAGTRLDALVACEGSAEKGDTLGLDLIPENTLRQYLVSEYDDHIVLVTEEQGAFNADLLGRAHLVAFADPTDGSERLRDFITAGLARGAVRPDDTFGDLLQSGAVVADWEGANGGTAILTGSSCSLTLVKRGEILFTVLLNYIAKRIFVACPEAVAHVSITRVRESSYKPDATWEALRFSEMGEAHRYVTFLGEESYLRYLKESNPREFDKLPDDTHPVGPGRILHLSALNPDPPGFILANGEKIGEWIGWLAFCRYSGELAAYALYPRTVFARDHVLIAPSPKYSILETRDGRLRLNFAKLRFFENPSRYRETILIAHRDNHAVFADLDPETSRELPVQERD
jgi:hypothetical protein